MRIIFLILILFVAATFADFKLREVEVVVFNIKNDGSASVRENIKIYVIDDYYQSRYDSAIDSNDLATWANITGLKDVRLHINPKTVGIADFRLQPRKLRNCDPNQNLCHGELALEYRVHPYYIDKNNRSIVHGTGLFVISAPRPRTTRYEINPASLSFTTTPKGDIIIEKNIILKILLQQRNTVIEARPPPDNEPSLPAAVNELLWTNAVLSKFSVVFEAEETLDREVVEFFSASFYRVRQLLEGEEALAVIILPSILVGAYVYLLALRSKKS